MFYCNISDEIFDNIDWGTDRVFLQQLNNAENLGASIKVLSTELQDVVGVLLTKSLALIRETNDTILSFDQLGIKHQKSCYIIKILLF